MVGRIGNIVPVNIEDEMRNSYLDYAMSVIVSRALPDVRDGLKPVQRRILHAMQEMGIGPNSQFRKSARIVGEVMGKYHPHGDAPVYEAMVRLAQDWSLRYPLVEGQGNFGSVDNDPAAAMRYTEARLQTIAMQLIIDIDQDTVPFIGNFDNSMQEPTVLPSRVPNLLVNGASGIAVGMATNIPPHNLSEICSGIDHLIENPAATIEDLLKYIKGPDFPTGGSIVGGSEGIRSAFATGRGKVVVRATATIEELRNNRYAVIVSELPYQINKADLVSRIAGLIKERRLEGASEIRDESDRDGMRIVVELRRDAQPQKVISNLYKRTAMQSAFHINMIALVDGQPQILTIKQALQHYIDFRVDVIRRRSEYQLSRAKDRAHLLEGLLIALQDIDTVISLIRNADDADAARESLMTSLTLSREQAQGILDMQLRRLAALESQRIIDEHEALVKTIQDLEALLASQQRVLETVSEETRALKKQFGDRRRTKIIDGAIEQTREDLEIHQQIVVTLSRRQYIKRIPGDTYHQQRRGGKGVRGMTTRDDDIVEQLIVADTHDTLLFFTNLGRVYALRAFDLPPDVSRTTRGVPLVNLIAMTGQERVQALLAVPSLSESGNLLLATQKGQIKRMPLSSLQNIRKSGVIAMKIKPKDELVTAQYASDDQDALMVSKNGQALRFRIDSLPLRSRTAGSIRGLRLKSDDELVSMDVVLPEGSLLLLSENGYGKLTKLKAFPTHNRGGQGIRAFAVNAKTGQLAAVRIMSGDEKEIMVGSAQAQVIRLDTHEIPTLGRATQGVILWRPSSRDKVISVAFVSEPTEDLSKADSPVVPTTSKSKRKADNKQNTSDDSVVENEDEEDLQDTFINESEDFLGDEGDEGDIDEANQLSLDID
jgi:DNA gyrase subunit A